MSKIMKKLLVIGALSVVLLVSLILALEIALTPSTVFASDCWYECGYYGSCTYGGGQSGYKVWLCCDIWPECHYQGCWPQSPC